MFASRALNLLLIASSLALTGSAFSAPAEPEKAAADPRVEISKKIQGSEPKDFAPTPVPGIFEYTKGADVGYVSADGKYYFGGDLYEIAGQNNLTEERRGGLRAKLLASLSEKDMIVFSPKDPKYTITVFTDLDCQYCRKLHSEIAEINKLGIKVRYAAYPRTGPGTESWSKAEAVWCSANRPDALTRAKQGQPVAGKACPANPVAREFALGNALGVNGTPGIVTSSGRYIGGYEPPRQLLEDIKASDTAFAAR
ncbi:MAG TPA: DsbC family protein [Steroidobacteraceae bacterium]|nr:DsbC family protein [Steroidobacteraceae bacterium]